METRGAADGEDGGSQYGSSTVTKTRHKPAEKLIFVLQMSAFISVICPVLNISLQIRTH